MTVIPHHRGWSRNAGPALALALILLAIGCGPTLRTPAPGRTPLTSLEEAYQQWRYWDDRQRLLVSLNASATPTGQTAAQVHDSLAASRTRIRRRRDAVVPATLSPADTLALRAIDRETRRLTGRSPESATAAPTCRPGASLTTLPRLTEQVFTCYGDAAAAIVVDGDTLNRLEILGLLARTDDATRRRRLFLALAPVWRSVNGDNGPASPYRTMLRLRRDSWGPTRSPIDSKAPAFGLTTARLEQWLTQGLEQWRAAMPDTLLEPWDWYYAVGAATRHLSPRLATIDRIRQVNDRFYSVLGADPARLRIHYDLEARPGKYPVAYTDFGSRPRWEQGRPQPGEPWVFASYLSGGFDNLAELLHETGHAVHIAAIRTRPAYLDWPDNDTFTEAIADLLGLDLYQPAWQQQFLGDSVSLTESLRAKYASIVFDFAWALFEIRVHQQPDADPNAIWTSITRDYLRITPHPEWSWWAMRGQLIDGPGYLINYALGAFMVADLRQTMAWRWGAESMRDPDRYQRLSSSIYRFGLERPSREVVEQFLGRPVGPDALIADLNRMSGH